MYGGIHIKLFPTKPPSPKDGDAYINNNGSLEVYYNYKWHTAISYDTLIREVYTNRKISSTDIIDHFFNKNIQEIINGILIALIQKGIIESIDQFKDILDAKNIADKLTK